MLLFLVQDTHQVPKYVQIVFEKVLFLKGDEPKYANAYFNHEAKA